MKKNILLTALVGILVLSSCSNDLDQLPFDKLSPEVAFSSEKDLELYSNSFYKILPSGKDIVRSDNMTDYVIGRTINNYLTGTYTAYDSGGWSWSDLRNINYFLEHYQNAAISQERKDHYQGLARFFRAWFYFEKVKRFGDVPWYEKTLAVDAPELYKPRDPRQEVMDKVLQDLDYAIANIQGNKDNSSSRITKQVALAFKSRVCLFEGTFRKYHTDLGLSDTADKWLEQAVISSDELIKANLYRLNTSGGDQSYRNLFNKEQPESSEVILAANASAAYRLFHDANWYYTSATYGNRSNLTKSFVNTYLNIDGSRFTDQNNYGLIAFSEEVANRDQRLEQTIRMGDYKRDGQFAAPDFTYTYTGYQPKKLTLDSSATDGVAENNNSLPIIRYAEVLLNYAEAKAELGDFTTSDWDKTIKLLRQRAGIKNTGMPTVADPYLIQNFYPKLTDANLLEIRRERAIELVLEGFRYDDLRRWKSAELLTKTYDGMYVPGLNILMDINNDGQADVCFVSKVPSDAQKGVYYYIIDNNQYKLSNGDSGTLILMDNLTRVFQEHQYLYPIPYKSIVLNSQLTQNKGW
ncbi:RagB/SusD family nutrient uptake outer membrane protein [Myroides pelagicus]|uniref:RagB/SusD family nutrient uptake outer membrane protein n=1 Tax=Myroides pelagicus TaxID=270914 RepID=A0A7K1GJT3_9FLAO|nr:RagB/SusD family nutrient uptake outer membrane protein [Myroides pelagicus]MEC4114124.1 RagB/SusD family nutrient uptake outer membrane protein [Myroides pelagicus]MTH28484.1 RagB/SusD family nutrient uptake outer membrane protein [Myroides pelagicus]